MQHVVAGMPRKATDLSICSIRYWLSAQKHSSQIPAVRRHARHAVWPTTFRRLDSVTSFPYSKQCHTRQFSTSSYSLSRAFVALGSNIGDSISTIEQACRLIDEDPDMRITDTSCLYRTKAMYVEDQADFINGACELETALDPHQLLDRLQGIEVKLGRVKVLDKGPRNIDLDIIGYGDQVVQTDRLQIPHKLLLERAFVLKPLCDMVNGTKWRPGNALCAGDHLKMLEDDLQSIVSIGGGQTIEATSPTRRTHLMSILNITPDSFSDGGRNYTANLDLLKQTIAAHVAAGAEMIDVGGQSSRPGALDVSAEEEIERVLPGIEAIRSMPECSDTIISVDTYRASVAEAAVHAGAHIINDISAGMLDSKMLDTIARLGCTYIMMHMRGTPATMSSKEHCHYEPDVVQGVSDELHGRVRQATEAGVRRWRIILDPGIGFAKDLQGNLQLLRHLKQLREPAIASSLAFKNMPWLVGTSKKRFIGEVTRVESTAERNWGTAATVTAAIAGGADIVRVHDVEPMSRVIKMADAIYR